MVVACTKLALSWMGNACLLTALGGKRFQGVRLALYWGLVAVGISVVSTVCYVLIPTPQGYSMIVAIAAVLFALAFFYENHENWGERCFLYLCFTCVAAVIATISEALVPTVSVLSGVVKLLWCIVIAVAYRRWLAIPAKKFFAQLEGRWRWVNGSGLLFSYICYYLMLSYLSGMVPFSMVMVIMTLTLINYIGLFCLLYYMGKDVALSQLKLQEELLLSQVQRLMDAESQARIMRHDLRHHNMTIAAFVQNGQYEEVLAYLSEYDQCMVLERQPKYCDHMLVSNILGVYHNRAQQLGIAFATEATVRQECSIGNRDLMGMLSNLLENAVRGCKDAENPKIDLKFYEKGTKLVIVCRNTALGQVQFQEGIPVSLNRNGSGMTSILRTVHRYDGMAEFRQEDGVFTAHIILNEEEREGAR